MKKQNERESQQKEEEEKENADKSMESALNSEVNLAANSEVNLAANSEVNLAANNAVYDVYMLTDSVPVSNVYDAEKHYLTIDDLLLHNGNDIFGEEFIYEGE